MSLLTLGKVISALADQVVNRKRVFIPYRESVLTWWEKLFFSIFSSPFKESGVGLLNKGGDVWKSCLILKSLAVVGHGKVIWVTTLAANQTLGMQWPGASPSGDSSGRMLCFSSSVFDRNHQNYCNKKPQLWKISVIIIWIHVLFLQVATLINHLFLFYDIL